MQIKTVQAVSGVIVAGFLTVHLANTYLGAFGPAVYDGVQQILRPLYQWLPVEVLLLSAIFIHGVSGVTRIVREPRRTLTLRSRLHRYAGFYMLFFIVGHVFAVRGPSWFAGVYPGFAGLAFSVDYVPAYFYPYYFLLGVTGFYHGMNGLILAGARLGWWRIPVPTAGLYGASVAAALMMGAALLAIGGITADVGDPGASEFARLYRSLVE